MTTKIIKVTSCQECPHYKTCKAWDNLSIDDRYDLSCQHAGPRYFILNNCPLDDETANEWIKTSDRLPSKNAFDSDDGYIKCYIVVDGRVLTRAWNIVKESWGCFFHKPTHWMLRKTPDAPNE